MILWGPEGHGRGPAFLACHDTLFTKQQTYDFPSKVSIQAWTSPPFSLLWLVGWRELAGHHAALCSMQWKILTVQCKPLTTMCFRAQWRRLVWNGPPQQLELIFALWPHRRLIQPCTQGNTRASLLLWQPKVGNHAHEQQQTIMMDTIITVIKYLNRNTGF